MSERARERLLRRIRRERVVAQDVAQEAPNARRVLRVQTRELSSLCGVVRGSCLREALGNRAAHPKWKDGHACSWL
jgi:hypothetical protein